MRACYSPFVLPLPGELLEQLCHPHAAQATAALAGSAARLLVETQHRPARRQAAVIVANLCTMSQIRDALLASDPPPDRHNVGIVDALAGLALGDDVRPGTKEEEIGMRRECMRALAGLANDPTARSFVSRFASLRSPRVSVSPPWRRVFILASTVT